MVAVFPDKASPPGVGAFVEAIGLARARWIRLDGWARDTYGVEGEPYFFGRTTGWTVRYRRAGRALFTLIPRIDGFSAIVVVGPTAWEAVAELALGVEARAALDAAHPYPEGRWAWIDVADDEIMADVMTLVEVKAPPPRRRTLSRA
jgi:uncharacterized protein DUF3788